jgi:hypothetical protein
MWGGGGIIFVLYLLKFSTINKRKCGVVVEGQGRDWECDGSSPGYDNFEKVIFFIKFGLILSNLIEICKNIDSTVYSCYMKKNFLQPPSGIEPLTLL